MISTLRGVIRQLKIIIQGIGWRLTKLSPEAKAILEEAKAILD
jgi:hypothetical protein